ncbi:WxL domain-containing protein, partial [Enterococcus sp. BWR-S5]|uniref:WxL domain-containing protein n=1 Tax=Enterococcus sp. BWR-S5 TaxID=2787714 RepID=UPI00192484DD
TDGPLRIDFVPTLNFGRNKITKSERLFSANAQLFHGDTPARGNFVQVSDYRGTGAGWTLQVRQEEQFTNNQTLNHQLKGAVLSFDSSWANSVRPQASGPTVKKEVIRIENIGATYTLAEAGKDKGEGTWAINFGASSENTNGMANTLSPSLDAEGNQVLDPTFDNKPVSKNSAVTLSVPTEIMIDPVPYTTVLTWTLSELP